MSKVSSVITTVLLMLLLFTECFIGYRLLFGTESVKVLLNDAPIITEDVKPLDIEEVFDKATGSVVKIYNYKFRLPGTILEVPSRTAGSVDYIAADGKMKTVTYTSSTGVSGVVSAISDFFSGKYDSLVSYMGINTTPENLSYYSQNTSVGAIASVYNDGDSNYYTFVPMSELYVVIKSPEIVTLTEDAETMIFGSAQDDPMTYHTYSMYEVTAIENTRNALSDGTYVGDVSDLPTEVTGSSVKYTSAADNETRKQMLNYGNFVWKSDGTSKDTSSTIDLTSESAKASTWVLTSSSPYSFTDNALKLHSLKATRNTDTFSIAGKITNQLASERPYIVVVKLLDTKNNLLGLKVVDKRSDPIPPNEVAEWSQVISSDSGIDLQEITSVQFEIY